MSISASKEKKTTLIHFSEEDIKSVKELSKTTGIPMKKIVVGLITKEAVNEYKKGIFK